jgi:hypothetical protein
MPSALDRSKSELARLPSPPVPPGAAAVVANRVMTYARQEKTKAVLPFERAATTAVRYRLLEWAGGSLLSGWGTCPSAARQTSWQLSVTGAGRRLPEYYLHGIFL